MGDTPPTERILCVLPFPEPKDTLARLRAKFPHAEVRFVPTGRAEGTGWGDNTASDNLYMDATVLVTLSALPLSRAAAPNLKLIHICSAGTNHLVDQPIYKDSSITITTSSGMHGPQIAEWVMMMALVHGHQYNDLYELHKQRVWGRHDDFRGVRDMVGQRVGILGYGSIGRQGTFALLAVGRIAKSLGMEVFAFTATPRDTPEQRKDNGYIVAGTGDIDGTVPDRWYSGLDKASLHEFLRQDLDMLVVCLPLTNETRHLLSDEEFDILAGRQAFLSNIGRGGVLDQAALVTALESKKLRGAALDVAEPEPLPPDNPLWAAPNLIITPHLSGLISNYAERAFHVLELNLERRGQGLGMLNIVNRDSGY